MNQLVNQENNLDEEDVLEPKNSLLSCLFNIFGSMFKQEKIGNMNGKWSMMLKFMILLFFVTIPTSIVWFTWVTSSVYGNNYNIERLNEKISELPPHEGCLPNIEWRRRIEILEREYVDINKDIIDIERKNAEEHKSMLLLLEHIKTKVDLMSK